MFHEGAWFFNMFRTARFFIHWTILGCNFLAHGHIQEIQTDITPSGMHGSNMGFSENRVPQNSNINHDQSSFSWLNGHTFDLAHFSDTTGLFPFYWPLKSIDWRRWTWSSKTTSVSWQRRLILMGIRWFIWVPTQIESPGVYKSGVDIDLPKFERVLFTSTSENPLNRGNYSEYILFVFTPANPNLTTSISICIYKYKNI